MLGIFSGGIYRIPHLTAFLGEPCCKVSLVRPLPDDITRIAVWGYRPSGTKAVALAEKKACRCCASKTVLSARWG